MKGITIKALGNFRNKAVQHPLLLKKALNDIAAIIDMPHFKIKTGKKFEFEDINQGLVFSSTTGDKAVLYPFT